jgi:molecular chaperone GrpE
MSPRENQEQGPVIRDRRRIDPATGQVRESGVPGPQRGQGNQHPTGASGPRTGPGSQHGADAPGPQRGPGGGSGGAGQASGGQPRPGRHSVSRPGGPGPGVPSAGAAGGGPESQHGADAADTGAADTGRAGSGDSEARANQAVTMLAERTADLQRLQAEYANYRKRVERDRIAVREQALANVLNELLPVLDDIGRAREHGELSGGFKSVAESLESIMAKLGLTSYGENGDVFDPTLHEALMHEYSDEVTEPTCVRILQPGYRVGDRIIRPARVAVAEPTGEIVLPPETGQGQAGTAQPEPSADLADEAGDNGNGS